jgi:hypothetical protein
LLFDKGKDTSSGRLRAADKGSHAGWPWASARNQSRKEIAMSTTTNKQILCGFGIDVDAVAGWLGSYGGQDSPFDISRGLFAGEVGTPRLLRLYDRYKMKTSWFIPGHSIRNVSRADARDRASRPRGRRAWLFA